MGRRKIEIQPITHERNRAITFLKRKNGLFKKAYELGVLCSVDVAVIILEDRPGHETKLHTYSSSNIRNIVQRQNRFQGEQDSRGPGDFSGAAAEKFDEDEEEEDVIDEPLQRRVSKRKMASKTGLTIPPDVAISNPPEYIPQPHSNGLPYFQNLAMSRGTYGDGSPSIGSLMPVSNDRVSNVRSSSRASKRPRISDSVPSRSRSSSIDHERFYLFGDAHKMRHLQNPYGPGESRDSYCPQRQYGSFFNMGGPAGPMDMGPLPPRFEPQYDPALYQHQYPPSMIRQASGSALGSRDGDNGVQSRDGQPQGITPRERGGEMFAAFLEADERSRQMAAAAAVAQRQQEQLNWSAASSQMSKGTARSVNANTVGTTTDNWFDLFSGPSLSTSKCSEPPNKPNIPWSEVEDIGADIARILAAKPSTASLTVQVAGAGAGAEKRGKSTDSEEVEVVMHRRVQVVADEAEKDAEGEDDVNVVGDGGLQADSANSSIKSSKDRKEKQTRNISLDVIDGTKTGAGRTRQKIVTTSSRGKGKGKVKRGC